MAKILTLLLFLTIVAATAEEPSGFLQSEEKAPLVRRRQKLSHLRFFWHDVVSGKSPTVVRIAPSAVNTSSMGFGTVMMMDNPLTVGPKLSSQLVGRCQGFYASTWLEDVGLMMAMNFVFKVGKYNGSTIAILGRNAVLTAVREMPIIGGSGVFRFARGYVEARTNWTNDKTGDATVEYNVYVLHH